MNQMFYGCKKLTSITLGSNFNTNKVTTLNQMFYSCAALTGLDLSNFDTSNVTTMNQMFYYCNNLTSIIFGSKFNTNKVTNIAGMFQFCNSLQELHIESWELNDITQTGVSTLPAGNDVKNEIYASVNFTVPDGWTLIIVPAA
jgi:surface protein